MPIRSALLRPLLALSLLAASACDEPAPVETFKSGVFDPPRDAPAFALTGSDGSTVTLERYRGKIVVLQFGFSHCLKICPVTLGKLSQVFHQLGPAAKDVQVVFVTVDPKRDDPARLRGWLATFNPTFVGATGTPEELEAVQKAYGVVATEAVSSDEGLGYEVHHSSSIYLIDRRGKLRLLSPFGKSSEDVLHDVRLLLREPAP